LKNPQKLSPAKKLFSQSEIRILELIKNGKNSKEIADELFLSVYTVNTHRRNMIKRTQTLNSIHLVLFAINAGYLI
jgi:DNA-binding NarL/FixJ family response regulator